jgi:hypothetical protein
MQASRSAASTHRGGAEGDPAHAPPARRPGPAGDSAFRLATHLPALRAGGPVIQRKCSCGGTCEHCREEEERLRLQRMPEGSDVGAPARDSPPPTVPGERGPFGIIVDDGATAAAGQVTRTAFMDALGERLLAVCNDELAEAGRTADDCPYLQSWLAYYRTRSPASIERAIRLYAGVDPEGATGPGALIEAVASRARIATRLWRITGVVPELPDGVSGDGMAPSVGSGEAIQEKPASLAAGHAAGPAPGAVRARLGAGAPLAGGVRTRMEGAFGTSFADVRVHTGSRAEQVSGSLDARAFTVGRDVAFGAGEFQPGTPAGDALIAHELAHVVQQRGGASRSPAESAGADYDRFERDADQAAIGAITSTWGGRAAEAAPLLRGGLQLQRCKGGKKAPVPPGIASDFQVGGRNEDPGDIESIYFDRGSSTIPSTQTPKIAKIVTAHAADTLTLNSYRSEDEPTTLAADRGNAVNAALGAAKPPHAKARTVVPLPASSVGRITYRDLRKVEVQVPPIGHAVAPPAQPACAAGVVAPCGTAFSLAQPRAITMLDAAITALTAAPLAAPTTSLLSDLFGGPVAGPAAAPTIVVKLTALRGHINDMSLPGRTVCHNACDGGCVNPAFNVGVGATAVMTLCPDFLNNTSVDDNAATLIHEGSHGTPGLATVDLAYGHTRLIRALTPADALRNTDSYVRLVQNLFSPGSAAIGIAADVIDATFTATERSAATAGLAHLEKWLTQAYQDASSAYDAVNTAVAGGAWSGATIGYEAETVHRLAPLFGLTDPGTSAPFTVPTASDKLKLAAIFDRYMAMRSVMWSKGVTMNKVAGADSWSAGPGNSVDLGPTFFGIAGAAAQVRHLVGLIAAAHPGISAGLLASYVDGADAMRRHRGLGP